MKLSKSILAMPILLGVLFGTIILPIKAAAGVVILSHTGYLDSFDYYHVVGEVQNVGDRAVNFVKIEATFYDSNDVIIDTRFDLTMLDVLLINRKSPFDIALLDATQSAKVDHYSLSPTFSATSPIPIGLKILSHSSYVDEIGCMHIVGKIKNIATEKACNVKMIATYYDAAGDVVAAAEYLDPEQPDIDPGQTKPFEIVLSEERTPYVDTYELTAESTEYAVFIEALPVQYELTIGVVGNGTTDPAPDTYMYDEGSEVSVYAYPNSGWKFSHWLRNGNNVGSANPYTLAMSTNYNLTAVFVKVPPVQYTLIVEIRGNGTTIPAPGTYRYDKGTLINVTAILGSSWNLSYWLLDNVNVSSENPYTILMDSNHNLTAVFVKVPPVRYMLVIEVSGNGTTYPAPDTYTYDKGSNVTVTAVPDSGWMLKCWLLNGADVVSANPYNVTMNSNYNLTAIFVEVPPVQHTLIIEVRGSGYTYPVVGSHLYDEGTGVSVTALPKYGWTLSHWLLNGTDVGSAHSYNVTMDANYNLTAVFVEVSQPPAQFPTGALILLAFTVLIVALVIYKRRLKQT